jgi:CubicO group peptidase (beta-lactamase class C family)
MKRKLSVMSGAVVKVVLISFCMTGCGNPREEKWPPAEEIIEKYLEATGGRKAHEKIKNVKQEMKVKSVIDGKEYKVFSYKERPNKNYLLSDLGAMGEMKSGSDGDVVWEISPITGTRVLEGEERIAKLLDNEFDGPDAWKSSYKIVKTEGIEDVNGKACYKVVLTPHELSPRVAYYDKESFLAAKYTMKVRIQSGSFKVDVFPEDYRKVGDILSPHKMSYFAMGQLLQTIIIESIEYDIEMPKGLFDLPEEIAKLVSGKADTDPSMKADLAEYQYSVPEDREDGWPVGDLGDHNLDKAKLVEMMKAIRGGLSTKIDYVLIAKDGVLVFDALIRTELDQMDRAFGNTKLEVHSLQSASKSFASALIGVAIEQGFIDSEQDLMLTYFPEYERIKHFNKQKKNWVIEDFLTMQTGLDWNETDTPYTSEENSLINVYNNYSDYVKAMFDMPMVHEPGTVFAYCSIGCVALGAAVANASDTRLEDFAKEYLFGPLQVESAIFLKTPVGRAHLGGGLLLSARDMAKFGQLYLRDGVWGGKRILPKGWAAASFDKHVVFSDSLTFYAHGYGYLWWLENFSVDDRRLNIVAAKGYGGQYIYVWPDQDAVIVFQGSNWSLDGSDGPDPAPRLMNDYIIPAFGQ